MKLIVDNREPKEIIAILKSRINNIELSNLDIGDFIIKNDNDDIIMLFERKSLSDLVASIKDGRYNEQSFRLSQTEINNHNIFYIIEGNIMNYCSKKQESIQKMIFSSMLSLSYKKGFSLLHTSGFVETSEFIIRFMEKLATEKKEPNNDISIEQNEQQYSNVIKTSKKANITKDNIGEIMLAQIPGLSITVAHALMYKYKTIKNLIDALIIDKDCLKDFQIEFKNGSRKINKTITIKLQEFLAIY
jgi:ERCC4-type nuclease